MDTLSRWNRLFCFPYNTLLLCVELTVCSGNFKINTPCPFIFHECDKFVVGRSIRRALFASNTRLRFYLCKITERNCPHTYTHDAYYIGLLLRQFAFYWGVAAIQHTLTHTNHPHKAIFCTICDRKDAVSGRGRDCKDNYSLVVLDISFNEIYKRQLGNLNVINLWMYCRQGSPSILYK